MKKKIAVDLDGVIFDTERYFRVFSDIEDVNNFGFNNVIDKKKTRFQDRYKWDKDFIEDFYSKNVYDFEKSSGVMPGVCYVLNYLKSRGYKLYIITARGFFSVKQMKLTIKLLKKYHLYNLFEEIIFKSKLKKDKLLEYNISYMIDDNLYICNSIKDICTPIYFKDGPLYDAKDDKIITVNNWADIYRFFKEKE